MRRPFAVEFYRNISAPEENSLYQSWTFAFPSSGQPARSNRLPLQVVARIFLTFECWQLSWALKTFNVSETGLLCGMAVTDEASAQTAGDLEVLLQAEPVVRIQIEPDRAHLFAPVVWARMVRCTRQSWGLELAFSLTESDADFSALINDLTGHS